MSSSEFNPGSLEIANERFRSFLGRASATLLRGRAKALPFPRQAQQRLLIVSQGERIPQSQVFPFHFYADDLRRAYGAEVREVSLDRVLAGNPIPSGATTIAFQTHFDIEDAELDCLLGALRKENPEVRLVYLDWTAPTDLRNASRLNSHVEVYVKKHVLRDRSQYGQATLGDTNLSHYYSRRNGIAEPQACFEIPPGFMQKLVVGPSFVTAPTILRALREPFRPQLKRSIDLHARFAVRGTPWYTAMRTEAESVLASVSDLRVAKGREPVPNHRFLSELRRSKVCFSPFGYGEVCWRDFEAIMTGAVLLKPDASHLEIEPDIFRPWETYVPVRWDLANFEETLRRLLTDDELRQFIARNAYTVLHKYLHSDAFARQMRPLIVD